MVGIRHFIIDGFANETDGQGKSRFYPGRFMLVYLDSSAQAFPALFLILDLVVVHKAVGNLYKII